MNSVILFLPAAVGVEELVAGAGGLGPEVPAAFDDTRTFGSGDARIRVRRMTDEATYYDDDQLAFVNGVVGADHATFAVDYTDLAQVKRLVRAAVAGRPSVVDNDVDPLSSGADFVAAMDRSPAWDWRAGPR